MEIQWSLLIFSFVAGCGGSVLAITGIAELAKWDTRNRRETLIVALALILLGGCASVTHLEQPANIMAAAAHIFSLSAISVELIMVGCAALCAIVYLVLVVRGGAASAIKVVAALGVLSGVLLGFVTGSGYMMGSQPAWNTVLLPFAYLGTDLAAGAFICQFVAVMRACPDADLKNCSRMALAMAAVSFVACLAYAVFAIANAEPMPLWEGAVVVAAACSVACAAAGCAKGAKPSFAASGILFACVAGVCLRCLMWLIGTGVVQLFDIAAAHGFI